MKKRTVALVALIFVLSISACGNQSEPPRSSNNITPSVKDNNSSGNPSGMLTDPSDYESSGGLDEKPKFLYAKLTDIVYNGLGNNYKNILDYSGLSSDPSSVGFGDHGLEGNYYTYFSNRDKNCDLIFSVTGDTYFCDTDICFGAKGWLERVFDYEKTQGPCEAKAFADILNAKNTYVISDTSNVLYVPSNLNCNGLYVIEADIETSQGLKSCVVYLEADSESDGISSDTWVEVILK